MGRVPIGLLNGWRRGVTEDEMVWCEMESPLNLLASPNKLDVVYLGKVSGSLIVRPRSVTLAIRVLSMAG